MKLIANKPCSFCGLKFYIGDEIPAKFVADAKLQEKLGVLTIVNDNGTEAPPGQHGDFYTQEQLDEMIQEAVDEAVNNAAAMQQEQIQKSAAGLQKFGSGVYEGTVMIPVRGDSSGENGQMTAVPATPEEIQQVFSIMQMNADEGAKSIAGIKSENVLILLHAADSRKTVKNTAKEQADKLFSTQGDLNEATGGNATTDTHTEGS